jgi:hypothetical protein
MVDPRQPMTPAEVRDLLTSCIEGPLPQTTVYRMMATLADWKPKIEAAAERAPVAGESLLMYVIQDLTAAFSNDERFLLFEYLQGRYCFGCGRREPDDPKAQKCQCRNDE